MTSIYDCHHRCNDSFSRLVAALKSPLRDFGDQMPVQGLTNEYMRFKVWSGSVGAKQPPVRRISLDYRLRDSEFYKIRVVDMLQRLERTLDAAIQLLRNERPPFEETDPDMDQPSGLDSDQSSTSSSTESSESYESSSISAQREMPRLYESVQNSVRHLYEMSMVIRQPIPTDRLSRASKIPVDHFRPFDERHVEECFPAASTVLKSRLANAITRRRQLVMYNEQHYRKSSEVRHEPSESPNRMPRNEPQAKNEGKDIKLPPATAGDFPATAEDAMYPTPSIFQRSTLASTEATRFTPPENLREGVDAQSESGTVSSFGFLDGDGENLRIPPRPQDDDGEPLEQFLCPLCYHLIQVKSARAWTKHVFRDLQAYVCTFDGCKEPDAFFETRQDWIRHEVENHRREWHCNDAGHAACSTESDFIAHMNASHQLRLSELQLRSLARVCERPSTEESVICPLCTDHHYDTENGFARYRSSSTVRMADDAALPEVFQSDESDIPELLETKFNEGVNQELIDKLTAWAISLPDEYEPPSPSITDACGMARPVQPPVHQQSSFTVPSTKLKRHLGQHLERLALFAISRSKMITDDQKSVSTDDAIPRSQSIWAPSTGSGSRCDVEAEEEDLASLQDITDDLPHTAPRNPKEGVFDDIEASEKESESSTIAALEREKLLEGKLNERDTKRLAALVARRAKAEQHATDAERAPRGSFHTVAWHREKQVALSKAAAVASQNRNAIIKSLVRPTQGLAEQYISKPYEGTFQWVFDNTAASLQDWLLKGSGCFWVMGPPGSGKSTLMKFISTHPKTVTSLASWAASSRLALATNHFSENSLFINWPIDSLLRRILFSILSMAPHLLTSLCDPEMFPTDSGTTAQASWTRGELYAAVETFSRMEEPRVKCCVFAHTRHNVWDTYPELVHLIYNLAQSPNFKFCVSSEPWDMFDPKFHPPRLQQIKLDECAKSDIERFASMELQKHQRWVPLETFSANLQPLIKDIVHRSRGLFLWASLVISHVIHVEMDYRSISEVQAMVRGLPGDLEDLVTTLFQSQDPVYSGSAWETITLALHTLSPLDIGIYTCHWERADAEFWDRLDVGGLSSAEAASKRIATFGKGLLKILDDNTVWFIHHEVHSFLRSETMVNWLQSHKNPDFLPSLNILRASLAYIYHSYLSNLAAGSAESSPSEPPVLLTHKIKEALRYGGAAEAEDTDKALGLLLDFEREIIYIAERGSASFSDGDEFRVPSEQARGWFRRLIPDGLAAIYAEWTAGRHFEL